MQAQRQQGELIGRMIVMRLHGSRIQIHGHENRLALRAGLSMNQGFAITGLESESPYQ
jgi:hypothetical protein